MPFSAKAAFGACSVVVMTLFSSTVLHMHNQRGGQVQPSPTEACTRNEVAKLFPNRPIILLLPGEPAKAEQKVSSLSSRLISILILNILTVLYLRYLIKTFKTGMEKVTYVDDSSLVELHQGVDDPSANYRGDFQHDTSNPVRSFLMYLDVLLNFL